MKKIPMLFAMTFDDEGRRVVDFSTFNERAIDALEGREIVATRKMDGTAMMIDEDGNWFARRIVKPGKKIPSGFVEVDFDPATGKHVGWVPAETSPFAKFWREAVREAEDDFEPGTTWELIGPKVNGNPEHAERHILVRHGEIEVEDFPAIEEIMEHDDPRALLEPIFERFRAEDVEGVVWWADGVPAGKLRAKDFFPEMDSRW